MYLSGHVIVAKLKYKGIYTVRFSLFDKFGALNSPPVFSAFARGLERHGIDRSHHDLSADVAVIWSVVCEKTTQYGIISETVLGQLWY
jgi:hypothetical protein